ncbi:MAG: succinylglutamate desuccinylase/aspartoacylase family protein [Candidatus Moraniibacteriota bacterium]|jgi:predicted deacylase
MNIQKKASNIYTISSTLPGTSIMILGGTHGNELTGIIVVRKLLQLFLNKNIILTRGSITLGFGNEEAIAQNSRWTKSGNNLNRFFTKEQLNNTDYSYESLRARILANLMQESDILIDLHSVNIPSKPFLACENTINHQEITKWFTGATDIITDPDYILSGGQYSTTDEYMNSLGKIGICFETGYSKDTSSIKTVLKNILSILNDQGLTKNNTGQSPVLNRNIYKMHSQIILTEAGFEYIDNFADGEFEPVTKNQTIGYAGSAPYKSPIDGIVLLQSPQNLWRLNDEIGYIAEKI